MNYHVFTYPARRFGFGYVIMRLGLAWLGFAWLCLAWARARTRPCHCEGSAEGSAVTERQRALPVLVHVRQADLNTEPLPSRLGRKFCCLRACYSSKGLQQNSLFIFGLRACYSSEPAYKYNTCSFPHTWERTIRPFGLLSTNLEKCVRVSHVAAFSHMRTAPR